MLIAMVLFLGLLSPSSSFGKCELMEMKSLFLLYSVLLRCWANRFYNYSKTVSRGVRDFSVELDGCLLHMGSLLRADR